MSGEISPIGNDSASGPTPGLRASHADRDRVVDVLRVAAGDGRLTAEELDERVEAALTARTFGELSALTTDLPATPGSPAAEFKDVMRIEQKHSPVTRSGRWVVPRRLVLRTEWCAVTLDFTQAVITQETLRIDVDMVGKNLTLVTRPGIVVDTDSLALELCRIKTRETPPRTVEPTTLRVELAGRKTHGRVVVRGPRRRLRQRLLNKPATPPTGD